MGKKTFYPLTDTTTMAEALELGFEKAQFYTSTFGLCLPRPDRDAIMAERVGEFRPPLKGEWYLSGAIPEAYRARNDLGDSFHILRLVRVREVRYLEKVEQPCESQSQN